MPKMNLYVPDELWEAAQRRKEINWSQVFQRAVKEQLGETMTKRRTPPMEQPDLDALINVEVLHERFTAQRAELYRRGYEIGIDYAQQTDFTKMCFFESIKWDTRQIIAFLFSADDLQARLVPLGDDWMLTDKPPKDAREKLIDALLSVPGYPLSSNPESFSPVHVIGDGFADALRRVWERAMQEETTNDVQERPPRSASDSA